MPASKPAVQPAAGLSRWVTIPEVRGAMSVRPRRQEEAAPMPDDDRLPVPPATRPIHRAEVSLMVTKDVALKARAEITSGGLLAVAGLVSAILLSTAVLVHVAVRDSRR